MASWGSAGRRWSLTSMIGATVLMAGLTVGCSSSDTTSGGAAERPTTSRRATAPDLTPLDADAEAALRAQVGDGSCDELDPARCLLPFPSDRFTVADATTDTGRRVHLPTGQLANAAGEPLDPTEWNRNDGFSPGTPMLISAPKVDLTLSGTPSIGDIGASTSDDSPTMLIDLTTGDRLAHWVELDQNAPEGQQLLIVRPAAALPEGHHIGVVLGPLVDDSGVPLEASPAFRAYRDARSTSIDAVESRRAVLEPLFAAADDAGLERATLFAAWDFTVASERNLSERLLAMRDDAFERLGDRAPAFTVDEVVSEGLPDGIGRRVVGTFSVPSYLTGDGSPGSRLNGAAEDRLPTAAPRDFIAGYTCQIPAVALAGGGGTTRPVVYGHGLLGGKGEAENSQVAKIASTNDMLYCATDWIGMSTGDLGNAVSILQNLSLFPSLPDRSQQGILNTLFLARVMRADGGFGSHAAFATTSGASVIDPSEVYYDGNSQGGIMGGAATAVSTEWTRAVLGVPGMDYALLLSRSVDFSKYFTVLQGSYPDPVDQAIIYPVLSMLWDRGEADGYAQHMTDDPYPGTPRHQVVLDVAFGDHQVSQVAAEMEARTIGAAVRGPALAAGRHPDLAPFAGLDVIEKFPTKRSVLIYWDSGSLRPPTGNITQAVSEEFTAACAGQSDDELDRDRRCADPHEDPRRAPGSIAQKDAFFRPDGRIIDPCDGRPCTAEHRALLDY